MIVKYRKGTHRTTAGAQRGSCGDRWLEHLNQDQAALPTSAWKYDVCKQIRAADAAGDIRLLPVVAA
jgi:hypothetical protein